MYNFDNLPNRAGHFSEKWNIKDNELPMWVADMDFDNAPEIKEAILKRVNGGCYGYTYTSDELLDAFISFFHDLHGIDYKKEDILFATGAIPALSSIIRKLTTVAEKVIILTPVYNVFNNCIVNNGRFTLESPLKYDEENNSYSIDFEDLEEKMNDPQASMLIMSNPQNPTGNIWSKEDLTKILALAKKHQIIVISDEIHCDIVTPGVKYTPVKSLIEEDDEVIIINSASKCFNMAGLQCSLVVVGNKKLRHKVNRGLNTDDVAEGNAFYNAAYTAAFRDSRKWLEEMNAYIYENKKYVYKFVKENTLGRVVVGDSLYLIWVDLAKYTDDTKELCAFIRSKTGLWINPGFVYGGNSKRFVRINLATSHATVEDGMNRLKKGLELWQNR